MIRQLPTDEQDQTNIINHHSTSTLQGRFRTSEKKKSSYTIWIVVGVAAIIYIYTVYYFIHLVKESVGADKVTQLAKDIKQLKENTKNNERTITLYRDQLNQHKALEDKFHADLKNQPSNSKGTQSQSSKPASTGKYPTPAPLTVETKPRPGRTYMTAQLEAIAEKRTQKAGNVDRSEETVSELKFLMKNSQGQTIDQVIYSNDEQRKKRIEQYQVRLTYLKDKPQFESLSLARYNFKIDSRLDDEQKRVQAEEYERVRAIHSLDKFKSEIPMCVVVPGYNNNAKFRLEYNLNSIFLQNYTNYFIVIINDASTDGSDQLFRKYLNFYQINKSKYVYIENSDRKTALQNIYMATHYYCSEDSVVVNLDGDDEFIGKNVLKIFNAGYQRHKAGVIFSNFYWYEQAVNIMLGFTSDYAQSEKDGNNYRQAPQRFSHLRSYKAEIFRKVEFKDFQDDQGKFYTIAYDMVIYFPVMELSCGRIKKIEGFHYLYNINTGLNDYQVDRNKQVATDSRVRGAKKYTCDKDFDAKMNQ